MFEANFDEAKVPEYTLPDLLMREDGSMVDGAPDWPARRAEILALFETLVYGLTPSKEIGVRAELLSEVEALEGKATRKEVLLTTTANRRTPPRTATTDSNTPATTTTTTPPPDK